MLSIHSVSSVCIKLYNNNNDDNEKWQRLYIRFAVTLDIFKWILTSYLWSSKKRRYHTRNTQVSVTIWFCTYWIWTEVPACVSQSSSSFRIRITNFWHQSYSSFFGVHLYSSLLVSFPHNLTKKHIKLFNHGVLSWRRWTPCWTIKCS